MNHEVAQPAASVTILLVSDYKGGEEKSWNDLRKAFRAWADQDFDGPIDFVLVESSACSEQVPEDLFDILPTCRVVFPDATDSYGLKNAGVEMCETEFVGVADADCIPDRHWARRMVEALRSGDRIAAVSGITRYPGKERLPRLLGLLGRSYVHPGGPGPTRFISGNAAGYRRLAYREHPLPLGLGPFASRVQSEAMLRDGWRFHFDPQMQMVHDFEGWPMEKDIRRHHGYCSVITRLHDSSLPYASLVRLGPVAIPAVVFGKLLLNFGDVFRCASAYELPWYEIPMALAFSVQLHLMEIGGMLTAYRGQPIEDSAYR